MPSYSTTLKTRLRSYQAGSAEHACPALPAPPPQREIDGIFRRMLLEGASAKQQAAPLTAAALVKLPRWRKVDPLVKSYLGNTLHLLGKEPRVAAGSCKRAC